MQNNTQTIAIQLALRFTEENKIPNRFKNQTTSQRKIDLDSKIELEFKKLVKEWEITIKTIRDNVNIDQANRYITLSPVVEQGLDNVTSCKDFNDFLEYLIDRRDNVICGDIELGHLAMLHTAFQNEIQKQIDVSTKKELPSQLVDLKNKEAQKLREKGQVTVDGIQVNLWQQHSFDNVSAQEQWNKVKSYAELNNNTSGENGKVVISGVLQIPRQEALEYAAKLGFNVHGNISKKTDYMILGSENVSPTKLAKAIELNEKGANIKFVDEDTFLEMLAENIN